MTSEWVELYNALEKAIGPNPARILMDRIQEPTDQATKADLADLRQFMVEEFATKSELAGFRGEMIHGFEKIDERFEKIDERFEKIDDRLFQFHETLRGYSRTFVTTQAASIVGAVGLAVALIKLF
jgi:hypothetical protein